VRKSAVGPPSLATRFHASYGEAPVALAFGGRSQGRRYPGGNGDTRQPDSDVLTGLLIADL